ncbi:MAG: threonylcarbamoyl-AMP synthase [Candidatus Portnoybacteria bacterium CG10_big_fil_rev_8_21_14_0_10_44_7]|uniref:L-threonylcarbamoyladenylate synthase n=1 Tax=Candidatus Portnoybacteria bacterium CG10_big_fil_rev_8_21_14_0_10_44_7 TaxID=1974816 RepID=A0A2M8KJ53_9BACT|nr:MAG: threonylcarbamoyl-AMP synthase [Candidatus Portnoybacteria bacterium CG10_big_fil_rev_8_21_14_0_10_44_7]
MKVLRVNPENLRESEKAIIEAAKIIYRGGSVVLPTDTVYGLAVDATRDITIDRLFKIKKRPKEKPVSVFVSDLPMARKIAFFDQRLERAAEVIWPGPLTVILKSRYKLPKNISGIQNTIGVRIPDYKLVRYLIELLGRPITATSANLSGQQPATDVQAVMAQFANQFLKPDLILDAGQLSPSQPSTVLDMTDPEPKIVRVGPVSKQKLLEILSV